MAGRWLIEQRENEVWAWSLEELLFLRLGRPGMGRVFDLNAEKLLGEFRWKTSLFSGDFAHMQPQMWVELLETQLADSSSDLWLARHFHLTPPNERAWQLLVFERGSRDSFCDCISFVFRQEPVLHSLATHERAMHPEEYMLLFRLEGEGNISWHCNFGWFYSGGGPYFPGLQAKLYQVLNFFGPKRNLELVKQRRASSDFMPVLGELHYPIKFSVSFEPHALSSHENLELFLKLRQFFENYLSPTESAHLLQQLASSR